jgi:hypothetical protein
MFPIKIGVGSVEVTISQEKRFKTLDNLLDIIPEELSASWVAVKQLIDGIVEQQLSKSNLVNSQNAKMWMIKRIYDALSRHDVDENILMDEIIKTGGIFRRGGKIINKKVNRRWKNKQR